MEGWWIREERGLTRIGVEEGLGRVLAVHRAAYVVRGVSTPVEDLLLELHALDVVRGPDGVLDAVVRAIVECDVGTRQEAGVVNRVGTGDSAALDNGVDPAACLRRRGVCPSHAVQTRSPRCDLNSMT